MRAGNGYIAARRAPAALLVAALLAALLPLAGAAAQAPESEYPGEVGSIVLRQGDGLVSTVRWRGATRFDTARLIATDRTAFAAPFETDTVVVARGDRFPDALAGSYLAGLTGSPILLSRSTALSVEAREALDELGAGSLVLLGGTAAISAEVESELRAAYGQDAVVRVGGADRYDTAALIARSDVVGGHDTATAIVASGEAFPDALVAGALAYSQGFPLLLTRPDELPAVTADALTDLGIDAVLLAGGVRAVSEAVEDELGALGLDVERVREPGAGRTGTAAAFARLAVERYGYSSGHFQLATGAEFADALTVAPHAGLEGAPILITNASGVVDAELEAYLDDSRSCGFLALHIAGGLVAVPTAVEDQLRAALTAGPCWVDLTQAASTNPVGETHTVVVDVRSNADAGVPDVPVTVRAMAVDTAEPRPESQTVVTGEDGTAAAELISDTVGEVFITACITDVHGEEICDEAGKTWYEPLPTLATGLDNPRGLEFGADGGLYVAETGVGGDDCVEVEEDFELCFGDSGAVTRVDVAAAAQERVFTGLPSFAAGFGATGPHDLSFAPDGAAYLPIGLGAPPEARDLLGPRAEPFGTLARVQPDGSIDYVADIAAFEGEQDPDGGGADSNPYGVAARADGQAVADAGGNTLVDVAADGQVSLLAVFPPVTTPEGPRESVPTSVVIGPDGAYYISELGGEFPGAARVWRVAPGGGEPEVVEDGFFFVLDLAFDDAGNLYVLQMVTPTDDELPPGAVVRVGADGSRATIANLGLTVPLGLAVGPDSHLYVSNCGISALCDAGGQVVRVDDPATAPDLGQTTGAAGPLMGDPGAALDDVARLTPHSPFGQLADWLRRRG